MRLFFSSASPFVRTWVQGPLSLTQVCADPVAYYSKRPPFIASHEGTQTAELDHSSMTDNNKLELVVEVDVNKANASIKSVKTGLSSMEQARRV